MQELMKNLKENSVIKIEYLYQEQLVNIQKNRYNIIIRQKPYMLLQGKRKKNSKE